jgi:hypothetical protein
MHDLRVTKRDLHKHAREYLAYIGSPGRRKSRRFHNNPFLGLLLRSVLSVYHRPLTMHH